MPTYSATAKGYAALWAKSELTGNAKATAQKIIGLRDRYEPIAETIGYPNIWPLIGALHAREADLSFAGVLHNGERIIGTGRKTSLVPAGRGPFSTWEEAAVDALQLKGWQSIDDWPIARWLYEAERYNGFGYFTKGINSPYVWAGTNLQQRGKYVADGKFDASTLDTQLGVAAILHAIFELDSALEPGKGEPAPPAIIDQEVITREIATAISAILEKYIMAGAAIPSTETALVPVKSAWLSKINWAAIGSSVASLATTNALGLDAATQAQVLVVVNLATNVLTFVLRTWFNNSVTPQSGG